MTHRQSSFHLSHRYEACFSLLPGNTYGLTFTLGDMCISGFVDSDLGNDEKDRKSMSGFILIIGGAPCIWGARKQISVELSTCDAKYYAFSDGVKEVLCLRRALEKAGISLGSATTIVLDN